MLNLWLMLKLMIRIMTNYDNVYLSIGLMSHVFFLESPLFWDGSKSPSFLVSCHLLVIVFAICAMGCKMAGITFSDILLPSRLSVWVSQTHPCHCAICTLGCKCGLICCHSLKCWCQKNLVYEGLGMCNLQSGQFKVLGIRCRC
jgi:hypothetical protein